MHSFDQIPIRTPAEALNQEIYEHADFGRKMPGLRIDRVDRNLGSLVARKDGREAPLLDIGPCDESRQEGDAAPPYSRVPQYLGIVGAQRPRDRNPMVTIRTRKLPLVAGGEMAVGQTRVLAQIVGMLRNPMSREISRTRA